MIILINTLLLALWLFNFCFQFYLEHSWESFRLDMIGKYQRIQVEPPYDLLQRKRYLVWKIVAGIFIVYHLTIILHELF